MVSRLPPPTRCRPYQTRFPFGFAAEPLNLAGDGKSPDHYAKGTRSPWGLPPIGLSPLVGVWFQVHYPPLTGVLPTVRSRYWFAIGRQAVLSLTGWAPQTRTHFHVLSRTQVPARPRSPGPSPCLPPSLQRDHRDLAASLLLFSVLRSTANVRL